MGNNKRRPYFFWTSETEGKFYTVEEMEKNYNPFICKPVFFIFFFPNLTEDPLNFVVRAKVKKPLFMPLEIHQLYRDREGQFFDPRHGERWEIQ